MDAYEKNQAALFERLLKPHMPRMFRFACRLTRSRSDAEDLFQDVLTKVFGRLDELAELRDAAPWLNRVLYNHFIDNQRRYARQRMALVTEAELPGQSIEALADVDRSAPDSRQTEERQALEKALGELSDEHRTVVLLHDVDGFKLKEIQKITGEALGTVKSRLHRARSRLRDLLRDQFGENGTFS